MTKCILIYLIYDLLGTYYFSDSLAVVSRREKWILLVANYCVVGSKMCDWWYRNTPSPSHFSTTSYESLIYK